MVRPFLRILAFFVGNIKKWPYHPFLTLYLGIKELRSHIFYSWIWKHNHRRIFFQLFFSKFLCTRYPGGPRGTTPRGKNPQNDFFLIKFFSQLILWVNTRWLTPRLSFYHKKWLSYGFLKFWGYPRGAKFQTPVKPKIWVREQKSSGFLNISPRATFTPKKSKFYFLRVFSFTDLCWNHPVVGGWFGEWFQTWKKGHPSRGPILF